MNKQEKILLLERIDQYINGKLSQDEIDELWKQFLTHPEWYGWFETELHLHSLIKKGKKPNFNQIEAENSSKTLAKQRYKVWIYAAAAAVLLAIGLQFFSYEQNEAIETFALTQIEESNLMGADVLRSEDQPVDKLNIEMNVALAKAYEGNTEQAIEKFQQLLKQSPNALQEARIEMNLGILFYNKEDFESAQTHFQYTTNMTNIEEYQKEKSLWFLGNTLLHLDDPRAAREAIYKAYIMNGSYQSKALSLLEKLDSRLGNIPSEESPERLGE